MYCGNKIVSNSFKLFQIVSTLQLRSGKLNMQEIVRELQMKEHRSAQKQNIY